MTLLDALQTAGIANVRGPEGQEQGSGLAAFDMSITYAPDVIVDAATPEDVAIAVAYAQSESIPIVPLGTGHGVLEAVEGGILITTRGMAAVDVDAANRTARVGAGTEWAAVVSEAAKHGLAGLCGSAPGVGVAGYLLGGGIGPLARTFGYSSDHVQSIDIVTPADGPITASPSEHPELFWALRGGKGGFGVVTSIVIDLLPIESLYGGGMYLSGAAAPAVLREFGAWSAALPESATSSIALLRLPDAPHLPGEIRGEFVAHLRFASVEDSTAAESLLSPIRELATPLLDLVGELPYSEIGSIHADPPGPMVVTSGGLTLTEFGPDAADALLDIAGPGKDVPLSAIEIRSLGGAAERDAATASAVGGRDAAFNLFVSGAPLPPEAHTAVEAAVRSALEAVQPWRGAQNLINFVGAANAEGDVARSWSAAQNERLAAARALADPHGISQSGIR